MTGRKNFKPCCGKSDAAPPSDTASDNDKDKFAAPTISHDSDKTRTVNAKGLRVLSNGTVSMRFLDVTHQVLTKTRDAEL